MSTLEVVARSAYGRINLYPANQTATLLAQVAGTKTLSVANLKAARLMGFTITVSGDTRAAEELQETLK